MTAAMGKDLPPDSLRYTREILVWISGQFSNLEKGGNEESARSHVQGIHFQSNLYLAATCFIKG
jgi:hypothetical protein